MPERQIPITLVVRSLSSEALLAEPLLFSELCCMERKIERVRSVVREVARKIVEGQPTFTLHHRALAGEPAVETVKITLDPPKKKVDWVEPVELEFHVVRWRHASEAYVAFVPALGIEVVAAREADLLRMIPEHILATLRRGKIAESLYELALTQRAESVKLDSIVLNANIKSPRQIEQDAGKEKAEKPAIEEVGIVLNDAPARPAYAMEAVVEQIADALKGRNPHSLLLIGPSGVGKTAAVHELVRRRIALGLAVPFWATSGSRLIAGMTGFGMWQKRCQRLCKEAARDGAILHVGNLIELMEVGRGGAGGQGIAGFLRPYLGRGEILAIAECTPEQLPLIERENPHLLEAFHQIRVEEPSQSQGRQILLMRAKEAGHLNLSPDTPWLDTLDRLHRRYATYSAYPGRPIRFLENLLKDRPTTAPLGPAEVIAAFSRETGLPQFMLDPEQPLDLAGAGKWFADRVIGQHRAVDRVTDLLATVKTALTRPRRPIASLLFIGPTGVGKTELAKGVAEYFFGDRNRLTRFDMSEFAGPLAISRLVEGAFGSEGLLTAKVREQPFSVILFDEFEKAHWSFFDLLLGILGEGRLTDAAGRLGDFSNAIVVMTSNLGAEAFGRGTFGLSRGSGFPDPQTHFTDEVRAFLRPELFNRIDRIVPFLPLDGETIRKVAEREIELVMRREGIAQRALGLEVTPAAYAHLSATGYDIRYGARPLKRAIERELLAPLAEAMNSYPHDLKLHAVADAKDGRMNVVVRAALDAGAKTTIVSASSSPLATLAKSSMNLRRYIQRLQRCTALLAVQNLLFFLKQEERRAKTNTKAKQKPTFDAVLANRIKVLDEIALPAEDLATSVKSLEDDVFAALYGADTDNRIALAGRLPPLNEKLQELLIALWAHSTDQANDVTVAVFGDKTYSWELARCYRSIAQKTGCAVRLCWFSRGPKDQLMRHTAQDVDKTLAEPSEKAIGLAMGFTGRYAGLRFAGEIGVHSFVDESEVKLCRVDISSIALREYEPPPRVEFRENLAGNVRRKYLLAESVAEDPELKRMTWTGRSFEPVLERAIAEYLRRTAWTVLDQ